MKGYNITHTHPVSLRLIELAATRINALRRRNPAEFHERAKAFTKGNRRVIWHLAPTKVCMCGHAIYPRIVFRRVPFARTRVYAVLEWGTEPQNTPMPMCQVTAEYLAMKDVLTWEDVAKIYNHSCPHARLTYLLFWRFDNANL